LPDTEKVRAGCLRMTREVYEAVAGTIGVARAEQGGVLGWRKDDQVIRVFRLDETAERTTATYSPDIKALNEMLREDWNPSGIRLAGFVHSHPPGCAEPSAGDLAYARRILSAIPDVPYLVLPIVQTEPDTGTFRLMPFIVTRDGDAVRSLHAELEIVDETLRQAAPSPEVLADAAFDRVSDAYDLARMARARVVAIGVGGAAGFIEDLARCGVGQFVLIDPDMVAVSNIATQQVYRKDIGHPKVAALAERLRDINPAATVQAIAGSFNDLDDDTMRELCRDAPGDQAPAVTLLCGLTDDFMAQARINALALHLGLPSLCAQVWLEGRGAEITFTYPGLTPACHRCVLASRYRAYLSDSFANDVTSYGTPVFATTRLNAIKGFLALALLHHTETQAAVGPTRFAGLAKRIGDRNLLQIRMDPDLAQSVGVDTFDRVFRGADHRSILFDETIWRSQRPRSGTNGEPTCPDCGGTGDLNDARNTFKDTRQIRQNATRK
jgi:proteasome lid subunit RPN8/RPN11